MDENRKLQKDSYNRDWNRSKKKKEFSSRFNSGELRWAVLLPKGLKQIQSNKRFIYLETLGMASLLNQ